MPTFSEISERVKRAAQEAGFDLAGIAPAGEFRELAYFPEWIKAGRAGEMRYMAARDEQGRLKRASLQHTAPWARSVVVCAINYNTAEPYSTAAASPERGWISRYAWSRQDYHAALISRLRKVETELQNFADGDVKTRCYVDTGPLVERVYAKYAGIGWMGKNTCVINQRLGSWLFLGVILTSLPLQPDLPAPDRCGSCTRCIQACPTEAFVGPWELDASRCISYLTIEKRGNIPQDLRAGVGRNVFGCDICQDVCPWNRKAPASLAPEFQPRPELINPALEWLASMSEEQFREIFRGSPIKRAKYSGLRRNAAVALGNSDDPAATALLQQLAKEEDAVVAEHARWALKQLKKRNVT